MSGVLLQSVTTDRLSSSTWPVIALTSPGSSLLVVYADNMGRSIAARPCGGADAPAGAEVGGAGVDDGVYLGAKNAEVDNGGADPPVGAKVGSVGVADGADPGVENAEAFVPVHERFGQHVFAGARAPWFLHLDPLPKRGLLCLLHLYQWLLGICSLNIAL
ncbi:hypothetical protein L1987_09752 [Smallanthus sonchifolius]|uniref:Uncharacterized protein n=1 Tax=Smallanthus sonchifolius TaxID=185202 RepID=A0ACB9JQG6_9ASTR|nr:hypothetical protein L1987_09752 [Smallanthus sonchifolius]